MLQDDSFGGVLCDMIESFWGCFNPRSGHDVVIHKEPSSSSELTEYQSNPDSVEGTLSQTHDISMVLLLLS